jgi:hypothetical protein
MSQTLTHRAFASLAAAGVTQAVAPVASSTPIVVALADLEPCWWCQRNPATTVDEKNDPACRDCRSEASALAARAKRRTRQIRQAYREDLRGGRFT